MLSEELEKKAEVRTLLLLRYKVFQFIYDSFIAENVLILIKCRITKRFN